MAQNAEGMAKVRAQRDPAGPSIRREQRNRTVLDGAIRVAEMQGYEAVSRRTVVLASGYSAGTVINAFGTMDALRDQVMAYAVEKERLAILAQGLAARSPVALAAPADLKERALKTLAA